MLRLQAFLRLWLRQSLLLLCLDMSSAFRPSSFPALGGCLSLEDSGVSPVFLEDPGLA
jgi:hypothetical protein